MTSELLGHVALPGDVASVPQARLYVRDLLGAIDHDRLDDALLLVTELVTNSVRHSDSGRHPNGQVTVIVTNRAETIQVDVTDQGSASHTPHVHTDVDCDSGGMRGLWLVQQLASAWGWHDAPAGRVVWFRMAKQPSERPGPAAHGSSPAGPGAPIPGLPDHGTPVPGLPDHGTPVPDLPDHGTPVPDLPDNGAPVMALSDHGAPIMDSADR
ncbi:MULTISPECIES: ATP-binding protein [Streptosporangium]|uniref:Anti-sigma regulatory factor (Ser/Thr protein kinase) n=1 Tax=Streptosporangium brasiliense TaxID=47480 RepID=A0ABT9R8Y9_9ACTN|nr:ATP-binding protein [Streptosporangium brasiliense]MDP9865697.1 anti-sigma regulatory factor (Ser/Thr protein kinase) [Streptosporangium brasiliense]